MRLTPSRRAGAKVVSTLADWSICPGQHQFGARLANGEVESESKRTLRGCGLVQVRSTKMPSA